MQSKNVLNRILALLMCFAMLLSYLPGISIGAKAEGTVTNDVAASVSTATDESEAESDLLTANLAWNGGHWDNISGTGTGLTAEKSSESVFGTQSAKAWAFKASAGANLNGATAQIHLTKTVDFSNHYLMMDVKYVTTGAEEAGSFTARLHDPSWGNLNNGQAVTVTPGDWQTVKLIPSESGMMDGKDVSALSACSLITFSFNFASTTGAERAIYIDNVRAVKIESAKEDWIKLPIDAGQSAELTYEVVTELSMGAGSTQSMKLYTTKKNGTICFNTQHAVEGKNAENPLPADKQLDAYPNMTSGILGGWFWFGESTPSGNVTLTYSDWGTSNSVDISFESKGNGWYYGTVDCAAFTSTTGSADNMDEAWRVKIAGLPKKSTMYIDCLTHTQQSMDGLSIVYPFNTETVQQTGSAVSSFNALTFISAINEVESAQLLLTPGFDVTGFELTMSSLVNGNGNVLPADDFEVYVQKYATATDTRNGGGQKTNADTGVTVWDAECEANAGAEGVFPNALVPQAAYIAKGENVISAGNNQGIWVNLNVGKDTAPGNYTGFATLTVNGTAVQIPVTAIIRDVTLPDEVHVKSSFQIWWDLLEAGEGKMDSALARNYEKYLKSKRLMTMDYWNITRYDDAFAENVIAYAQDPAISSYALKYGKTAEGTLDTELLTATLTAIINKNIELAQAGSDVDLLAKAYLYFGQICDEPRSDEAYARVNDCTAKLEAVKAELAPMLADYPALQESLLNLKHLVTGPDPLDKTYAFINAQDYGTTAMTGESYIYVPQYQWLHTEAQRAMYADQDELWWYGCTHPVNPYPGLSFNSPLITSRALGWMMYDYDIDGLLYWCVNSWGSYGENGIELKDYWNNYSGFPGEGILILPGVDYGVDGPIGTIRIESLRESMEDYEYLWLLEQFTGSDSEIATYTAGMYEGAIPSTDITVHHRNRINLLNRLESLSIDANGATVKTADLPTMPVDPQPEPEVINYPVDIIALGTCANAEEQSQVTNGTDTAWKLTTATGWVYPSITLDKEYDISNHMLVMEVKVTGMNNCRMNLATIEGNWGAGSGSTYLSDLEGWNTMTFDLSANGAGLTEMTRFSLGFEIVASSEDYAIYIDNLYLIPLETVENDWIHMAQDTGSYYKNTTTSFSYDMLKAKNSGMSMKVEAPADVSGKFALNPELAVINGVLAERPDFSSGMLGAWFYFGRQQPSASLLLTSSNDKGSIPVSFNFVYGGEGWYYGTVDTSKITYYDENGDGAPDGDLVGIKRIRFQIPAGYTVYIDGITFPEVETVTEVPMEYYEPEGDDWTNMAFSSAADAVLTEELHYAEASSQSLKVVTGNRNAAVVLNAQSFVDAGYLAALPDFTEGILSAWFYFGDAEPSASVTVVDDAGFSSDVVGAIDFIFESDDDGDGWYYGSLNTADIAMDDWDMEDGASTDAIASISIHLPANYTVYIDCLGLETEDEPATEPPATEPPATEPPASEPEADADPGDLLSKATAADTVGVLGGGNYSYDANAAVTYGDSSTKSWMFAGNESAAGWPTALLNLGKGYDMSGKVLAFNIKTEGGRGYIAISSLHEAGSWANVCAKDQFNISMTFDASDWATVYFNLDDIVAEGKSLSNVQFLKLGFDFDTNAGAERKYYIDNVRLLDHYETVENDWIHMGRDTGGSETTVDYILDMDHVKAPDSSLSMKIVSGESDGTYTLNPALEYGSGIDMTSGILGGYFYFGDAEPSVKIRLTDKSWNGGATLSLTMVDAGDGWYYGYVDAEEFYFYADQIANGASAAEIIRIKLFFPANTTVYMDGLMFPTEIPEEYLPTEPDPTEPEPEEPTTTEPETEPAVIGDDFLANAEIACGELQTEVTNGSASAWKLVPQLGSEHNWAYPGIVLDKAYSISKHKLVMDVKPVNMSTYRINMTSINGESLSGVSSQYLTADTWNTVTFDLSAFGIAEMSKFGLGMEIVGGEDYAIYIDNVKLICVETLDEDLLNLTVDAGESVDGTYEKVDSFTKDENSGLAMKLIPTAGADAKVSMNVNHLLGDNYDMSTGVLGAWFYFGDQTPSASTNFSGNWSASVTQSWSFGAGVDGWYYGKIDLTTTTFYEEKGTMADVERIRIYIPAGYEPVYVDYLTYNADGATLADEAESDMLSSGTFAWNPATWTEELGTGYGKDLYNVNGEKSFRSWYFKANAAASNSPVAQLHLNKSFDATGKLLVFDVKFDAPEGTDVDIKTRLHKASWGDITTDAIKGVAAGDWTTVRFDPSAYLLSGETLADVSLITFTFNFVANAGVERTVYIDNVRLVAPETVDQDWINLSQDTGTHYCNSTAGVTDEKVKAEGSTFSIKATAPADVQGKFTFKTDSITPDLSNGILGAWFYFGDAEPGASVTFTSANWKGSIPASFSFGEGEDGWYYGTLDTSRVSFYDENNDGQPDGDLHAVIRLQINFPAGSTIYVDGLTYTASKADVQQWNIDLEDDLKANFHLSVDDSVKETAQIVITVGSSAPVYYNVAELSVNEAGCYEVSAYVAAAQMTDDILVQVVNGEEILRTAFYTVRGYADYILADEAYSEYHAVVKEMLNYGAAAQAYFGNNTDDLANAGIDGVGASEIPASADADMSVSGKADGISFYAASLVYKDKVAVRFYFDAESINGLTFAANGAECEAVLKGDYYMIEVSDIYPEDLDDQITVTVTDGSGNVLTVCYGPMNYIVRMNAKGSDSLKALLKAMYNYHLAAETLRPDAA